MSDEFKLKVKNTRFEEILKGKSLNGISQNASPKCPPAWFDPVVFKHAQDLFKTYNLIIRISQLYGLNLVLYHESGLVPLLITGQSESIPKLFKRYLSTGLHVSIWYESDPFDPSSKSYRSLKAVRGLHRQIAGKMNSTVDQIKPGELWISQTSMSLAQFTFIGMMTVFPIELGFHNFKSNDFHAMFHFWRVIGYCLGIDDQYNLCNGSDEEIVELCHHIYYTEWLPVIRQGGATTGVEMSKGICSAISITNPLVNFNVMMRYASHFMGLNPDNYPLQSLNEKVIYCLLALLLKFMTRSRSMNWGFAKFSKFLVRHTVANREELAKKLEKKHSDAPRYTFDRCPFQIKINYADAFELKLAE